MTNLDSAVQKLQLYIELNNYKGYDPYDGLTSPLFKLPFFKTNKKVRLYSQQLIKRFPINFRPLLKIKKGYNPVTLGLCIQGYTNLLKISSFSIQHSKLKDKIEFLIDQLIKLQSKGYSGACWGYDFDWQSSVVSIPAYGPTIVATGIITNALFEYFNLVNSDRAREIILSSVDFVLKDLQKTYDGNNFCFSYSPFDKECIFNANMKAIRLLAQAYSISKNEKLISEASQALNYVIAHQNEDGSWFYSNKSKNKRIDNYHTGYVLDCMKSYIDLTDDVSPLKQLDKGFNYYISNFVEADGKPKFYHDSLYPIDSTSASQTILTLCKFDQIDLAKRVAEYMIDNMQSDDGFMYFRRYKYFTNKISYMRWSNGWMFAALTYLIKKSGS